MTIAPRTNPRTTCRVTNLTLFCLLCHVSRPRLNMATYPTQEGSLVRPCYLPFFVCAFLQLTGREPRREGRARAHNQGFDGSLPRQTKPCAWQYFLPHHPRHFYFLPPSLIEPVSSFCRKWRRRNIGRYFRLDSLLWWRRRTVAPPSHRNRLCVHRHNRRRRG